jgi:tetratricopeptide (TPR) repeat protein
LEAGRREAATRHLEASSQANRAEAIVAGSFANTTGFPPVAVSELRAWRDTLLAWDASDVPPCSEADATGFLCTHEADYQLLKEFFLGLIAARLGEGDAAQQYALVVEGWSPTADDPYLPSDLAHTLRALVASMDGRPEEALAELEMVSRERNIVKVRASSLYQMAQPHFLRAEALKELGRYDEAIRWYTAVSDILIELVPAAHLRIGEIHEARGETDQAVERYGAFVELWAGADPEMQPLVDDVRNRIAVLVGEPTP